MAEMTVEAPFQPSWDRRKTMSHASVALIEGAGKGADRERSMPAAVPPVSFGETEAGRAVRASSKMVTPLRGSHIKYTSGGRNTLVFLLQPRLMCAFCLRRGSSLALTARSPDAHFTCRSVEFQSNERSVAVAQLLAVR